MNQVQLDLEEGAFIVVYTLTCVIDANSRLYRVKSADKHVDYFINVL